MHLAPHDLRRTFITFGVANCGIDFHKIELLTNHVPKGVTARHYLERVTCNISGPKCSALRIGLSSSEGERGERGAAAGLRKSGKPENIQQQQQLAKTTASVLQLPLTHLAFPSLRAMRRDAINEKCCMGRRRATSIGNAMRFAHRLPFVFLRIGGLAERHRPCKPTTCPSSSFASCSTTPQEAPTAHRRSGRSDRACSPTLGSSTATKAPAPFLHASRHPLRFLRRARCSRMARVGRAHRVPASKSRPPKYITGGRPCANRTALWLFQVALHCRLAHAQPINKKATGSAHRCRSEDEHE